MVRSPSEIPEKDRKRDKYLRKHYSIGIDTYNAIGEAQGWKCGACGRPASDFTVAMNVDHKHFSVEFQRLSIHNWRAQTHMRGSVFYEMGRTKEEAKGALLRRVLPLSIRGLLCPGRYTGCNRLLGRVDRIEWLKAVLQYLENPPAWKIIS